jgi:hypothetical protein
MPPVGKVTLCHIQGKKKDGSVKRRTIRVRAVSVADHLAHGDTLGACP